MRLNLIDLAIEPPTKHSQFFSESGWGGRLSVGQREYGRILVLPCQPLQLPVERLQNRQIYLFHDILPHKRIGQIIYIFRCKGKVNPWLKRFFDLALYVILNRFYIVVDGGLNILDFFCCCCVAASTTRLE